MNPGADRLFQLRRSPPGPLESCGCLFFERNPIHSYCPVPMVGRRRSSPLGRFGRYPDEKYAVRFRDTYAQLKVKPNWLAVRQKRDGEDALPSVMSFSAPRLSPSRPNVERFRERAYGAPPTVAVAKTFPCTVW